MRRIHALMAACSLVIGGAVFAADPPAVNPATPPPANDVTRTEVRTDTMNKPATAAPDADDIRKTVAIATDNAVSKNGFDNLVNRFVDADQKRLKDFKPADNFDKLNGRADQFAKDWKAKYGQDFGFETHRNDVLNDSFARISQGEIGEARTAGNKEQPSNEPKVTGGTAEDLKKTGVNQTDANSNKTGGGNTNREPGRNIASFIILPQAQASANLGQPGQAAGARLAASSEMPIPLIHELPDTWKIDLPDNIDGQKLYDNVLKHLTMVDEDKNNWPADVNEAYRSVTRHMMMAVMDSGGKDMQMNMGNQNANQPAAPK
jgi:hypothetical protein